ncbi:MAG: AsmA-like C-terminal region-containing protein [Bacteroidales bacterium]
MKILRNPVRLLLVTAGLTLTALLVITMVYKDRVAEIFISEINSRSEFTTTISDSKLTLLKRFPRASFILEDIAVRGPVAVNGNDTIITAAIVSLEFRIINLLRKNYTIEWVGISGGKIHLLTGEDGISNLPSIADGSDDNQVVSVNLKNIRLNDISLNYANDLKEVYNMIHINTARLNGSIAGTDIRLKAEASFGLLNLSMNGITINNKVDGSLTLDLHKSDSAVTLNKGTLDLQDMAFAINGFYAPGTGMTNLSISSGNADISSLSGFLPDKFQTWLKYRPSGKVSALCHIEGILSSESKLRYDVAFSMHGAGFEIPGTGIRFRESSLSGFYTNGERLNAASSQIVFDMIDIKTANSSLRGSLSYTNFARPALKADINPVLDLSEVAALSGGSFPAGATGRVRASVSLNSRLPEDGKVTLKSVAAMNPVGNFWLSSVSLNVNEYSLSDITGNLMLSGNLWVDSLQMGINGQRIQADGEIRNFTRWVSGEATLVEINGYLGSPHLTPGMLMRKGTTDEPDSSGSFKMPRGYSADIRFSIGEFYHKSFSAFDASGRLGYSSGRLLLDDLALRSMNGDVAGSAVLTERDDGGFGIDTRLTFDKIDINNAFVSFNNFRQDFIVAENLKGSLTGKYDMLMDLDGRFVPDLWSISSEGSFTIDNGELLGFPPVMNLSRFIEISELENIRFSRLENEFYIKSGTFAIPHMEIKSSAADFGISGKHLFNGDYEYHLRVLLSQILSRKAPKKNPGNEFGIVEDDELGRTSLFLLLSRQGDKEAVTYDGRAARSVIREDLRNEKQSLKVILKEELGWYGMDTTVIRQEEQKPKFRIIWDEVIQPDTIKTDTVRKDQKSSTVRSLLKKIIKG